MRSHIRIIAGERRGWKLEAPKGKLLTRPITDRVKENLFNILQARVPDAVVLDLFAGTGALGLEALSRGARWATFVEQHRDVADVLKRNVAHLRYEPASRVITGDALRLRPAVRDSGLRQVGDDLVFDLVFVDPPYAMMNDELMRGRIGDALEELMAFGALAEGATIVVRRETHLKADYLWPHMRRGQSRTYGSMTLDFFEVEGSSPSDA